MPVCDVCDKNIRWEDGYVLTTRQVPTSEAYWELTLQGNWSYLHNMDPEGEGLVALVRQQAGQSSGWLVCEECSRRFSFDKVQAKADAKKQNANPPGSGPAPTEAVARSAAIVWKRLYGAWPSSVQPAGVSPTQAAPARQSRSVKKSSSSCFIATAIYGDANCHEVELLREFRDRVLAKTTAGRLFVASYYHLGPFAARKIERWPRARAVCRRILDRIVILIALYVKRR